ncbi:MAG: LamG-like jellyroll fold domain-containing protein [bacterium]|nr:LamG-like jellyroll fold domain-containing protein [bacterium]
MTKTKTKTKKRAVKKIKKAITARSGMRRKKIARKKSVSRRQNTPKLPQKRLRKVGTSRGKRMKGYLVNMARKLLALALIVSLNGVVISNIGYTAGYYNDIETSDNNTFIADQLDFILDESDWSPASQELDLEPGETVSRDVTIVDIDDLSIDFKYVVSPEKISGDDDFCNALELEASLEGVPQYTGLLFNFQSATTTFATTTDDWTFDISLPSSAPEFINKSCHFDFVFSGWQNEFPNEGEGYHDEERLSNLIQSPGEPFDPSVCPFEDGPGKSIIHFNNKTMVASGNLAAATDGPVVGFLPAGTYDITLASYDGHLSHPGQTQLNEQWKLIMKNAAGTEIAATAPSPDIPNEPIEQVVGLVENDFILSEDAYQFTALHDAYPDSNPNSLRALCAQFEGDNLPGDIPESDPPPVGRTTDGLLALYTFEENSGQVVFDVSGVGAPLNLWIPDPSKISWITGGLSVDSATLISSFVPGLKLINGLQATDEITIEAWIKPANITQDGPARIATLSKDTGERNFTLGQDADKYTGRLRTTTTGLNGTTPPAPVFTPSGAVDTTLQHVVYTRTPDTAKMYVNGVEVINQTIAGNFSNWNSSFRFGLANEFSMDRTWLGDYCLVAVYDKDLSSVEVSANFAAGAGTCGGELGVVLNEIYPAPPSSGNPVAPNDREWVELYNGGASSIDVLGWKISELSGGIGAEQVYTISTTCSAPSASKVIPYNGASTIITVNGLLVLEFCTGENVLNNPGDTVRLYDSTNILLDLHTYPSTANGKSHQRIPNGGIWVDPEPTPGAPNRVSMRDLIEAGLDEETIAKIVTLLAERGETLLEEESTDFNPFAPIFDLFTPVTESASSTPEIVLEETASTQPSPTSSAEATDGQGVTVGEVEEVEEEISRVALDTLEVATSTPSTDSMDSPQASSGQTEPVLEAVEEEIILPEPTLEEITPEESVEIPDEEPTPTSEAVGVPTESVGIVPEESPAVIEETPQPSPEATAGEAVVIETPAEAIAGEAAE